MMNPIQQRPKRPMLQINTSQVPNSKIASSRKITMIDPKDPTAMNTLSNVYATAIDRCTPVQAEPITAINTTLCRKPLQIQTGEQLKSVQQRTQTPYAAFAPTLPDTPLTANPKSPLHDPQFIFPSAAMTATPPMSAGPVENQPGPRFSFTPADTLPKLSLCVSAQQKANRPTVPASPLTPQRPDVRAMHPNLSPPAPYTHPSKLHSILRNSPLPSALLSPRRQSARLQEKAAKRVAYNNPLTQTIINEKYLLSHIDLLREDMPSPSPMSPANAIIIAETDGNETRDGGMTPGPLEDMRRKLATLGTNSPMLGSGGIRKKKKVRADRRRQWRWTINHDDDDDQEIGGALAAIRAAEKAKREQEIRNGKTPRNNGSPSSSPPLFLQPAVYVPGSQSAGFERTPSLDSQDIEMSDSSSMYSDDSAPTPENELSDMGMELDDAFTGGQQQLQHEEQAKSIVSAATELLTPVARRAQTYQGKIREDSPVPAGMLIE